MRSNAESVTELHIFSFAFLISLFLYEKDNLFGLIFLGFQVVNHVLEISRPGWMVQGAMVYKSLFLFYFCCLTCLMFLPGLRADLTTIALLAFLFTVVFPDSHQTCFLFGVFFFISPIFSLSSASLSIRLPDNLWFYLSCWFFMTSNYFAGANFPKASQARLFCKSYDMNFF